MNDGLDFESFYALQLAAVALLLYSIYGVVYRLYLSPISSFPGPKLAALTFWYEFYYDVFPLCGQYTFHLITLHQKYGPIIRINPYELHISSPDFYETLYSSTQKRDKWYWFTKLFGMNDSSFATVDHAKHRMRRAALNPYFSGRSVRRLQPVVDEKVEACLRRFRGLRGTGDVVRLVTVTSALSHDVIMMYCFGNSFDRLEAPDFDEDGYEAAHQSAVMGVIMKHMIWILWIVKMLPDSLVKRLHPGLAGLVEIKMIHRKRINDIKSEKNVSHQDVEHPTIFHELLSSKLPDEEKTTERLGDEAVTVVGAGGETVAWTLAVTTYYLLANPAILQKLKTELLEAIPDLNTVAPQTTLASLPYLTGEIKEGLRLSYGVSSRLQRVPHEPLSFSAPDRDWIIPAWTPVGMTSTIMHHDESIFPESKIFRPERWIENPRLDRYLVSFSKGSRQCLGMTLAYAEMYSWTAAVFRRFGSKEVGFEGDEGILELVDTDISDVELASDCLVPAVKSGSKGVMIRVLS